jgi:V8-like Glu-specific endopeptidase
VIFGEIEVCTATLVGKRHIITASHCAPWRNYQDNSPPDDMIFEAAYNPGTPYSDAKIIHAYWYVKNSGPSWTQGNQGGDWLVGVLDRDMQLTNGYLGLQTYLPQYSGQYLWSVLGYPLGIYSGMRQMSESPLAVTDVQKATYGDIYTVEGLFQKASGAPLYTKNEAGATRIVGINAGPNNNMGFEMLFHGGPLMIKLVNLAKTYYP